MPVLRSREIISITSPNKQLKPVQTGSGQRKSQPGQAISLVDAETVRRENGEDKGILSLGSGKIVTPQIEVNNDADHVDVSINLDETSEGLNMKIEKVELLGKIAHLNIAGSSGSIGAEEFDKSLTNDECAAFGNNKRKFCWDVKAGVIEVEDAVKLNPGQMSEDTGVKTMRYWKEGNQIEKVVGDELPSYSNSALYDDLLLVNPSQKLSGKESMASNNHDLKVRRTLSMKDKGKEKVVEDGSLTNIAGPLGLSLRHVIGDANDEEELRSSISLAGDASVQVIEKKSDVVNNSRPFMADARDNLSGNLVPGLEDPRKRFRQFAQRNASRFALYSTQEPKDNHVNNQPVAEMTGVGADREVEGTPGPFSSAMKEIRERESNVRMAQQSFTSEKGKTGSINWIPKNERSMRCAPTLQNLCIDVLAKHADAISSLESVPDAIRHKLSQIVCDSRKMDAQFLGLLVCGSPTEICIKDCSWLTEEEFIRAFKNCEPSLLKVLQLDQCGRCLADYLLRESLARSPNSLPMLTTLSIKGACRLSDAGLTALLASAPALRSINLGQCSLLTCNGIKTLADSLGSILRELYMDDCDGLDPMLILPALLKLEQLEVLSLAGIETVSDVFVKELVAVRGRNFKELVLRDCMKLTDSSLKAIAETCTGLHALDLSNLRLLTDSTLVYLANGCRSVTRLKLSRNAFSDEAVAAYLEASGEPLKELSLNNIRKVGENTAISLAKCSRKLLILDLSWCRNLTNEALGLIVEKCASLKVLKLFGCTQITNVFVNGHSNSQLQIIGLKLTPVLKKLIISEPQQGPLKYSAVF